VTNVFNIAASHNISAASIWLENWRIVGPGLKTDGVVDSWNLEVKQKETRSTGFMVSSPDFVFNIHKSFYF